MVSTGPAKVVPYPAAINTVTGICRDPKNEPILECAERAEAECIVTGDHDLLSLAS